SSNYTASLAKVWGNPGDTPVAGDYDNDGKADYAVYRQAVGKWEILKSTTGYTVPLNLSFGGTNAVAVVPTVPFAYPNDVSRAGDFDGDTRSEIATYHPTTGNWSWLTSGSGYATSLTKSWGGTGYTAAPGDYDGDGRTDLGIYRT